MNYENEELSKVLRSNIQNLKNLYEKGSAENKRLIQQISEVTEKLRVKEKEYAELELKNNTLKMAKMLVAKEEDTTQAKTRINSLVREIDKCVALLNK